MAIQNETGMDLAGTMSRIQKARDLAESLSREKSRITGELGALQNQLQELGSKCKNDFDCNIEELPEFITQLKIEAEKSLSNAEIILGLKQGTVQEPVQETVQEPVQAPKVKFHSTLKKAILTEDNDGLIG